MLHFTAGIQHSEKTYRRLCQIQYWCFYKALELKTLLAGAVVVLLSLPIQSGTWSIVVLFVGCWLVASSQTPPLRLAKKMIEELYGVFPQTEYAFFSDIFVVKNQFGERREVYSAIENLVEDGNTIILFKTDKSGYMIDMMLLQGEKRDFLFFLEEKTGKTILQSSELHSMNHLLQSIKSVFKTSLAFRPPRL